MKKKLLPLAMLAGLAGAVGTAQAAHLNPDGLGQVLIYPYYTTLNGQHTDIHLVNTTNTTKAVKIRFLEGQNSREVRDFHLYLSAYDHWSGVITVTGEGDQKRALFKTADTSCTVPAIPSAGIDFTNYAYIPDAGSDSLARTLEGYVEVIEMAVLGEEVGGVVTELGSNPFGAAEAAKHVNGVPKDCAKLVTAWSGGGQWRAAPTANTVAGTGGLYGFATVFNVAEGTSATYSATAIDAFEPNISLHQNTGSVLPSLAQVDPAINIFDANHVDFVVSDVLTGIDAVSALLTRDTLQNDYITDEGLAAETDWVITFPTKRFYVDRADPEDRQPFNSAFTKDDRACEHIELVYFDREERVMDNQDAPQFSPARPGEGFELCTEVNVLSFNGSDVLGSSTGLDKTLRYNLNTEAGFVDGWAKIDFTVPTVNDPADYNPRTVVGDDYDYAGLPVVGFAVIKYTNGNLSGVLSNYTGVVDHKYTRAITAN